MITISIMGYVAIFLTGYNMSCGMLQRLANDDGAAKISGIEAALWFVAASVCFK